MSYEDNKKWRLKNPTIRYEGKTRNYQTTQHGNINKCQRYSLEEELLILNSTMSDRELHQMIGRSVQAIQIKRSSLKRKLR